MGGWRWAKRNTYRRLRYTRRVAEKERKAVYDSPS